MRTRSLTTLLLVIVLALEARGASLSAIGSVGADNGTTAQDSFDVTQAEGRIQQALFVSTPGGAADGGFASAQILASADYGLLGISVGGRANGWGDAGATSLVTGGGLGTVRFSDSIVVMPSNAALINTIGSFDFRAGVAGSGNASAGGGNDLGAEATYDAGASFGFAGCPGPNCEVFTASGTWSASSTSPPTFTGDALDAGIGGRVTVVFGVPIFFTVQLDAAAGGRAFRDAGAARAFTDLIGTLRWEGITAVRDADGNSITSYTALSPETGIDWARPAVPEPGTAALLALGIAGVALGNRCQQAARHGRRVPGES